MASKIQQVKDHINSQIERRIYNPGQMIASESELVKRTGASRTTVRIALRDLVDRGVLYKEKGRGTFVAIRPRYSAFRWGCGFTKEAQRHGGSQATSLAYARQEAAHALEAPHAGAVEVRPLWCAPAPAPDLRQLRFLQGRTGRPVARSLARAILNDLHPAHRD